MQGKWYNIKLNPLVVYCIAFFFFSSTQQSIRQINKSRIKDYICENLQRLLPLPAQTHSMRNIQRFVMPLMDLCDPGIVSCHPVALNIRYFRKGNIYIYIMYVYIYIYIYIFWLWLSFLNTNAFGRCFDRTLHSRYACFLNQIKSLLLSHHHSTCALVSEILESVLQTVQEQFTYRQYILTQNTHTYSQYTQCTIRHTCSYQ